MLKRELTFYNNIIAAVLNTLLLIITFATGEYAILLIVVINYIAIFLKLYGFVNKEKKNIIKEVDNEIKEVENEMKNAEYYIKNLNMKKHIEGGYFNECFKSQEDINIDGKGKNLWSSIYFLLKTGEVSNFHRLKSDELWYYHAGEALTIYMINQEGDLLTKQLGLDIDKGEMPQVLVPKGYIFGSAMNNDGFTLVGCMVSPGFEYTDFELFDREYLLNKYPGHKDIIMKLTRE